MGAGVDIIAHGVRDKPVDAEFIDVMKTRSLWYIATIVLDYSNFASRSSRPGCSSHSSNARCILPCVRSWMILRIASARLRRLPRRKTEQPSRPTSRI